jgi:mannose/fructose/N-acetylgalactosamine-specific phosphotransferase system component IIB
MNLIGVRVDDRLIHGQVVVGCCESLEVKRLVLANDEAAEDPLQSRLFRLAVPPSIDLQILALQDAISYLRDLQESADREPTLLVLESPQDVSRLVDGGVPIDEVVLGGIHHHQESREIWPGYFLDEFQMEALRRLSRRGISIAVQSIPGASRIDGRAALESH